MTSGDHDEAWWTLRCGWPRPLPFTQPWGTGPSSGEGRAGRTEPGTGSHAWGLLRTCSIAAEREKLTFSLKLVTETSDIWEKASPVL